MKIQRKRQQAVGVKMTQRQSLVEDEDDLVAPGRDKKMCRCGFLAHDPLHTGRSLDLLHSDQSIPASSA